MFNEFSLLQEEKVEHSETRIRLSEITEKLETAMGRIEQINKQLEQEKSAYQKAYEYFLIHIASQVYHKSLRLRVSCVRKSLFIDTVRNG